MSKPIFMLSSHGAFSELKEKNQIANFKEQCGQAATTIYEKFNGLDGLYDDVKKDEVIIGYDGDGYYNTPPVTYLFLVVINKFIESGINVTPMISQITGYMPDDLKVSINTTDDIQKQCNAYSDIKLFTSLNIKSFFIN